MSKIAILMINHTLRTQVIEVQRSLQMCKCEVQHSLKIGHLCIQSMKLLVLPLTHQDIVTSPRRWRSIVWSQSEAVIISKGHIMLLLNHQSTKYHRAIKCIHNEMICHHFKQFLIIKTCLLSKCMRDFKKLTGCIRKILNFTIT